MKLLKTRAEKVEFIEGVNVKESNK